MRFLTSTGFSTAETVSHITITPVEKAAPVTVNKANVIPSVLVVGPVKIPVHVRLLAKLKGSNNVERGTLSSRQFTRKGQPETELLIDSENTRDEADRGRILAYLAPTAPCGYNLCFSTSEDRVIAWKTVEEPRDNSIRNQRRGQRDEILVELDPGEVAVAHISPVGDSSRVENFFFCHLGDEAGWRTEEEYNRLVQELDAPATTDVASEKELPLVELLAGQVLEVITEETVPSRAQPAVSIPLVEMLAGQVLEVVTEETVPSRAQPAVSIPLVEMLAGQVLEVVTEEAAPELLTSGSTGQPKTVPVELPIATNKVVDPEVQAGLAELLTRFGQGGQRKKGGGL